MTTTTRPTPTVSVLAEHVSDHLSVFVVAEDTDAKRPANGGLRLLNYPSDEACIADGERLAVVQQRDGRTELLLYRRSVAAVQRLPLDPPGVPRSVSLDGSGRRLAVQVSRDGRWQVDLIRLP